MIVTVEAQGTTLTAAELREALEAVDDAAPVYVNGRDVVTAHGADLSLELQTG